MLSTGGITTTIGFNKDDPTSAPASAIATAVSTPIHPCDARRGRRPRGPSPSSVCTPERYMGRSGAVIPAPTAAAAAVPALEALEAMALATLATVSLTPPLSQPWRYVTTLTDARRIRVRAEEAI